jgi:hypothetical protein
VPAASDIIPTAISSMSMSGRSEPGNDPTITLSFYLPRI